MADLWEYKIIDVQTDGRYKADPESPNYERTLDDLGGAGWEFNAVLNWRTASGYVLFRRLKQAQATVAPISITGVPHR